MWSRIWSRGNNVSSSAPPLPSFSVASISQLHAKLLEQRALGPSASPTVVVESIRHIGEVLVYGDQRRNEERNGGGVISGNGSGGGAGSGASERYLEVFCELNVLRTFVELYRDAGEYALPGVAAQVLQTVSILLLNAARSSTLFFLLSNNHINDLIEAPLDETDEEAIGFYVSLLKTLSLAFGTGAADTLQFFFLVDAAPRRTNNSGGGGSSSSSKSSSDTLAAAAQRVAPPRFPLFSAALHFSAAADGMVRTTTRQIVLNCLRARDASVREFLCGAPAVALCALLETALLETLKTADAILSSPNADTRDANYRLDGAWGALVDEFLYWGDVMALPDAEEDDAAAAGDVESLSTLRPLTHLLETTLLRGRIGEFLIRSSMRRDKGEIADISAALAFRTWTLIASAILPTNAIFAVHLVTLLTDVVEGENGSSVLDAAVIAAGSRADARTARCAIEFISALVALGAASAPIDATTSVSKGPCVRSLLTSFGLGIDEWGVVVTKVESATNVENALSPVSSPLSSSTPRLLIEGEFPIHFHGVSKGGDIDTIDTGARPSGPRPMRPSSAAAASSPVSPSSPTRRERAATSSAALTGVSKNGSSTQRGRAESFDVAAVPSPTVRRQAPYWEKSQLSTTRGASPGTISSVIPTLPLVSMAVKIARSDAMEVALIRVLGATPPPDPATVDDIVRLLCTLRVCEGGARLALSEAGMLAARTALASSADALVNLVRTASQGGGMDVAVLPLLVGIDAAADVDARASVILSMLAAAGAAPDGVDSDVPLLPLPLLPAEAEVARSARTVLASLASRSVGVSSTTMGSSAAAVRAVARTSAESSVQLCCPCPIDGSMATRDEFSTAASSAYVSMRQVCALRAILRAASARALRLLRDAATMGLAKGTAADDLVLGEWACDDMQVREFVCPLDAISPGNTFTLSALAWAPATLWAISMRELPSPLGDGGSAAADGGATALAVLAERVRDGSAAPRRVAVVLGKTFLVIAEPLVARAAPPPPAPPPRARARALAVLPLHTTFVSPVPAAGVAGAASVVDVRFVARGWGDQAPRPAAPIVVTPSPVSRASLPLALPSTPPPGPDTSPSERAAWRPTPRVLGCTLAFESVERAAAVVAHVDAARSRVLRARTNALDMLKGGGDAVEGF